MAERIPIPTESAKCNWADGGTYPSTDPGAPARLAGFKPKDYPVAGSGAIVPAEDHNFLWRLGMEMLSWMRDFVTRQWADIAEGITASSARDIFRVMPADAISERGATVFTVTGTGSGGSYVGNPCTDGEQIYYYGGTGSVVAASPVDGAEIWDNAPNPASISAICTDGSYVYILGDSGDPGLSRLIRTTGVEDSNAGTYYGGTRMLCNSDYAAVIETSAGAGTVAVYSDIQGTITQDGNFASGSTGLRDVAIDRSHCYVGGIRNSHDIWCVILSTLSHRWRITLPTGATDPNVRGIVADGCRVYVATDDTTLAAGGQANLYALDRWTGAVLWSMEVGSSKDLTNGIATDGRFIYVSDSADDMHIIDISGPAPSHYGGTVTGGSVVPDMINPVCDGVSVIGNSNLTTELKRVWMMDAVSTFRRVDGDDLQRRPFYTLAVPTEIR